MIVLCALPTAFLQLKTNTRILTPSPLPSHSSSSSSSSSLHRKVVFSTSLDRGDVSIKVGSQVSASWAFAHLSPSINDATIDYLHTTLYDTQGGVEYTILGSFFGQAIETLRVTVGGTGGKGAAEALHISVYVQSTFGLCSVYVQSMFMYKFRAHTDFLLLEPPCPKSPKVRRRQPSSITPRVKRWQIRTD